MFWLTDLARIASLLLLSASVCAVAFLIAKAIRIDRVWLRVVRGLPSPDQVIVEMVHLAEVAAAAGLLAIEPDVERSTLPLLKRGVALAAAGTAPVEVREILETELESSVGRFRIIRKLFGASSHVLVGVSLLVALAFQFLAAVVAASGVVPVANPWWFIAGLPAFAILVCTPTLLQRSQPPPAARMMVGMLVIEGLSLIMLGVRGDSVRVQLGRLLPSPPAGSESSAQAA